MVDMKEYWKAASTAFWKAMRSAVKLASLKENLKADHLAAKSESTKAGGLVCWTVDSMVASKVVLMVGQTVDHSDELKVA